MLQRIIAMLLPCSLLASCSAPTPKYEAPPGAKTAKLLIKAPFPGGRRDSSSAYRSEFTCDAKGAFVFGRGSSRNLATFGEARDGTITETTIATGFADYSAYVYRGDTSCSLHFSAKLEAGRSYEMVIGSRSESQLLIFITHFCSVAVTDMQTGRAVPLVVVKDPPEEDDPRCEPAGKPAQGVPQLARQAHRQ